MKTFKSIITAIILLVSFSASGQTLEGKWQGSNPAGEFLKVEFKADNTIYFNLNGTDINTIEFEAFYNTTPNSVIISYYPNGSNKKVRVMTGLFELLNHPNLNFIFMESDGNVFPSSFQGCFNLTMVNGWSSDPRPSLIDQ